MSNWNQNGAGSCGVAPAMAERQLDVVRWLEQLGYVTERIGVAIGALEGRLSPAMGPNTQNTCNDAAIAPGCPMASELQVRVVALNEVEERIHSILRRLEF